MNIDDLMDALEDLSQEELIKKAKEAIDKIIDNLTKWAKENTELNSDFVVQTLNFFIESACGVDGRVDKKEYEIASELIDYLGLDVPELDQVRQMVTYLIENDKINNTIGILAETSASCDKTYDTDLGETVIELAACIFMYNGSMDSAEIKVLRDLASNTLESSLNQSNNSGSINSSVTSEDEAIDSHDDKALVLTKHDCTMARDDDFYYLSIGAEIDNPNANRIAQGVTIKVIVKDSSGRILETSESMIEHIDGKSTFYYGQEIRVDSGTPSSYAIQLNTDMFVDGPEDFNIASTVICSHYNVERDRWGDTIFSANVHNSNDATINLELFFVFYDDNENIVGGCSGYVGRLYSNSDDTISATLHTNATRSKVCASPAFNFYDIV